MAKWKGHGQVFDIIYATESWGPLRIPIAALRFAG